MPPGLPIATIQAAVAEHFGVQVIDLVSDRRDRDAVRARQAAIYLCRRHTPLSLPAIGRQFGNRDHTTVLHSCRRVEARLATEPDFAAALGQIEARLLNLEIGGN